MTYIYSKRADYAFLTLISDRRGNFAVIVHSYVLRIPHQQCIYYSLRHYLHLWTIFLCSLNSNSLRKSQLTFVFNPLMVIEGRKSV